MSRAGPVGPALLVTSLVVDNAFQIVATGPHPVSRAWPIGPALLTGGPL